MTALDLNRSNNQDHYHVTYITKTENKKKDKKREGQRGKELFSATNNEDANYDAYEKDIAIVSFYFDQSSIVQFKRSLRILADCICSSPS
mgnify:CR=1 FL=1